MGRNPKQQTQGGVSARANGVTTANTPSVDALRARGHAYWANIKSREPLADQLRWVRQPEARAMMGRRWCKAKREELLATQWLLRETVPSGWWYDQAWKGRESFPPQERFCPLASVAWLYGEAAAGRIRAKRLFALFAKLERGIDPRQLLSRRGGRMRLSLGLASMPETAYDEQGQPLLVPPTRRITPPQSVGVGQGNDDHYDRMSALMALFCTDESSVTAKQIIRIGILKGREQSEIDKEKREKKKRHDAKIRAAKAKAGVEDEEPKLEENILDEDIDVDCTDVRGVIGH